MNFEKTILDNLTEEDLTTDLKDIKDEFGFEIAKRLLIFRGGSKISIPMPSYYSNKALKNYLIKNINEDFKVDKLSRKFNLSYASVKKIIKELNIQLN